MTQDHYYGRRVAKTGARELLEAVDQASADDDSNAEKYG